MKTVSLCNKRNPTNANAQTYEGPNWTNTYLKETEYIQDQINKIKNSVEDRQSWIAWQTVNEVKGRAPQELN